MAPLGRSPTRAGNTIGQRQPRADQAVHPRAGGEHFSSSRVSPHSSGSSPRGRGTRARSRSIGVVLRFIPARAGNTARGTPGLANITVHPRAGGEHCPRHAGAREYNGSSPRGRGTLSPRRHQPVHPQFIPARAENTWRQPGASMGSTVHPRAGGEHGRTFRASTNVTGSSPRGRGTGIWIPGVFPAVPTCAIKPLLSTSCRRTRLLSDSAPVSDIPSLSPPRQGGSEEG